VDAESFRRGLFALPNRRFGTVAEMLVRRLVAAGDGLSVFHDLYDRATGQRIEVKFSRVCRRHETPVTMETLYACLADAAADKAVPFAEWRVHDFDCNIQQIKRDLFDVLVYGLFFSDRIVVFRARAEDIATSAEIGASDPGRTFIRFSDKQHKGNVGEGQFHITGQNLGFHLARFHLADLDYGEFMSWLGGDPEESQRKAGSS